jgi:hypothetical protein
LNEADEHNTEETEGLLNAAVVPICTLPGSNSVCNWPLCGSTPYEPQCLRPQIHHSSCGMFCILIQLQIPENDNFILLLWDLNVLEKNACQDNICQML